MRRVVVTGLGIVSPLASGVEETWERLLAGVSGAGVIDTFDASDLACRIGCCVPMGDGTDGTFCPTDSVSEKLVRRVDRFIVFGLAASSQAVSDADWFPDDDESQCRTGVMIGSGIGGIGWIESSSLLLERSGPRRLSPFFLPGSLVNLLSGYVSMEYGFRGPNHALSTACSTGSHSIGEGAAMIARDDADVMICGGAEAGITRLGISGFLACRALSTGFNDDPVRASRPYDRARDGFVMGEGAGVLVLEALDHALGRGVRIYGEVVGYGVSGDAYHITAPSTDGDGAYRSMSMALKRAGLGMGDIDYINGHGTSTPLGDDIELGAVMRLAGSCSGSLSLSSTKSSVGHMLGAAGAVEGIFSLLALRDGVMPPTLNLDSPSFETDIDLVPCESKRKDLRYVLSNSFGFGGTNSSLIFSRFDG